MNTIISGYEWLIGVCASLLASVFGIARYISKIEERTKSNTHRMNAQDLKNEEQDKIISELKAEYSKIDGKLDILINLSTDKK